jgi:hypothetical protein
MFLKNAAYQTIIGRAKLRNLLHIRTIIEL